MPKIPLSEVTGQRITFLVKFLVKIIEATLLSLVSLTIPHKKLLKHFEQPEGLPGNISPKVGNEGHFSKIITYAGPLLKCGYFKNRHI